MSILDDHRRFHFVGIGGAGMSALAELLVARGYEVSGCDRRPGPAAARLVRLGVDVREGHGDHAAPGSALVVTSAVPLDHPEIVAARERGDLVVRRAELLGTVMDRMRGIAVAGTHGKSTTTAMIGAVLEAAGGDPTVLVGGRIRGREGNARIGQGPWLVAEADEFDRSFLALSPECAVINNLEADHLDTYGTMDALREAFGHFVGRTREGGVVALGIDDPEVRGLRVPPGRRAVTFGLHVEADVRGSGIERRRLETGFLIRLPDQEAIPVILGLPGAHNVLNALGAAAAAWGLGIPRDAIVRGLAAGQGVERRFEIVHEDADILIVDDYAHHPSEIAATLESARSGWPERRLVAVFQPHLYSRTRDLAREFGAALASADLVFVTNVYAAREEPIPGVSGRLVSEAARTASAEAIDVENGMAADTVAARLEPGDLVVTMGAGDIDSLARDLALRRRRKGEGDGC
ncbi:MAG: UDP-N-acetylmuramate--L-alanine ligase [Gemmatimonadota bacterium]